jgi:hypothetical protein
MIGKEVFVLHVKRPSRVFLLHNAELSEGYVEFRGCFLSDADSKQLKYI